MPTLFPENYEKQSALKKRKLLQLLDIETEISALDIALNAHNIYSYLKQLGVEKPNSIFIKLFQYASDTLDVPYGVIDEAFFTQTPLDEKKLFDVSQRFNPKAELPEETELPVVPITIDFCSICLSLIEELPDSFWGQFLKSEKSFAKENIESYNLEKLLQGFLQEVWLKVKAEVDSTDKQKLEDMRLMFLAYFYQNNQKYYRIETQEMLLVNFQEHLNLKAAERIKIDNELYHNLKKGDPQIIQSWIYERLNDWTVTENYQRVLRSISKTKNLSLLNKLLLLYQCPEGVETKEINEWIRENRNLKKDAHPVFLFGEKSTKVDTETGEIIQRQEMNLNEERLFPLVPYFLKSDTEGRESEEQVKFTPSQIFATFEKLVESPIVFEELEMSKVDNHTIRLKSGQEEEQTIKDLVICILEKEKESVDSITRFENLSVAAVLFYVFDFEPLPMDFTVLENFRKLNNGKIKLQQLFTTVIHRSESFLEKLEVEFAEKKTEKIRQTLEEEIAYAKNLQKLAMENVATDKENNAEKKSDTPFSMEKFVEKSKEGFDEDNDDRDD
ncbi:hypothetical protein MCG01_05365 [Enterococcus hirae]|nr:hypothetical protein [Enterococcus hirae]